MERVAGRDAAFLYLEGPTTPYHIAGLLLADGTPPTQRELTVSIERALVALPALRKRLAHVPIVRTPIWVEDDGFDIEYHLRRVTVPPPGDLEAVKRVAGELMEDHLNRYRPLWQLWVMDGVAGDRFAMLLKIHHSMADGMMGAQELLLLFDTTRRGGRRHGPGPVAGRVPGPGLGARAAERARSVVGTAMSAMEAVEALSDAAVHPAPRTPFNVAIGPNRTIDFVTTPLQDFEDVKRALGGTVNDVVLAVTAGGLRHWLRTREVVPDGLVLRALVPVSLRGAGDRSSTGNQVGGILAPLPVGEADPVRRLELVRSATSSAKSSRRAAGTGLILGLPALLPGPLTARVSDVQRFQRFFNLSLPNIRGPARPLYVCGRPIREIVPLPPLSANAGLLVAAMSYAGAMTIGLVADRDSVPDLGLLAEGIEKSIVEMIHAGGGA